MLFFWKCSCFWINSCCLFIFSSSYFFKHMRQNLYSDNSHFGFSFAVYSFSWLSYVVSFFLPEFILTQMSALSPGFMCVNVSYLVHSAGIWTYFCQWPGVLPTWNNLKFTLPFSSFLPHKYCDVGLYIVWNYKYVSLQPDSTKIAVKQSPFWTMVWFLEDLRFMRRSILGDSSPWSGLRFLSSFILKQMFKASRFLMKSQAKPALAPAYSLGFCFHFYSELSRFLLLCQCNSVTQYCLSSSILFYQKYQSHPGHLAY